MDIRKSRVEASCVDQLRGLSKRIGPGQHVDLDEPFGDGSLRDVFQEDYFEPAAAAEPAAEQEA